MLSLALELEGPAAGRPAARLRDITLAAANLDGLGLAEHPSLQVSGC